MEIQHYLNKTTPILTNFLNIVLPKICGNWWDECVIGKLTESQRKQIIIRKIDSLDFLDLAALLRVLNNNWQEISYIKNLSVEVRNYTNEMLTIRNNFAHLGNTAPNIDDIDRAADTIQRFVKALDKENELVDEIREFRNSLKSFSSVILKGELDIQISEKKNEVTRNKEESVGKLVQRYIQKILDYCLSEDELELMRLQDKETSNEIFGINFPFLKEVTPNSVKTDRYWKTKFVCKNQYFVVTSEWYERNRKKFINYLNDKKLLELIDGQIIIPKSVNSITKEEKIFSDINFEIVKIHKRIPKWFKSPNQINHKILVKYLELRGQNEFVYFTELDHQLQSIKTLRANCNQMNKFGFNNHAKVFDEINGKIYLWEPVKEFILEEFNSIQ